METTDNIFIGKISGIIENLNEIKTAIIYYDSYIKENLKLENELRNQKTRNKMQNSSLGDEQIRNTIIEFLKNSNSQGDLSSYIDWLKNIPVPVSVPTGKVEVFILDPETGKLCTVESWKKDSNPKRAEWVAIRNEKGEVILLHKNGITVDGDPEIKFNIANKVASAFVEGGHTGSRKDWIDVYEAIHTAELNKALELIGGEIIRVKYYWTKEKDSDQSYAAYAWIFCGGSGCLYGGNSRLYAYYARVFRAY